jgi:hypothetical protein
VLMACSRGRKQPTSDGGPAGALGRGRCHQWAARVGPGAGALERAPGEYSGPQACSGCWRPWEARGLGRAVSWARTPRGQGATVFDCPDLQKL